MSHPTSVCDSGSFNLNGPAEELHRLDMIPVVIGIVGHRDIPEDDEEKITIAIEKKLRDIMQECPSSPIYLLTALAEGADRLAVRAAERIKNSASSGLTNRAPFGSAQLKIGAILPLPVLEYQKDFSSATSLQEFEDMLERSDWHYEPNIKSISVAKSGFRDECYRANGLFIARHSQLIIACWDGVHKGMVGGTSDMVHFALNGLDQAKPRSSNITDFPDTRPVTHIFTWRTMTEEECPKDMDPGDVDELFPSYQWATAGVSSEPNKDEKERWRDIRARFDEFNRAVLHESSKSADPFKKERSYLFGQKSVGKETIEAIPLEKLDGKSHVSAGIYGAAEALSMKAQHRRARSINAILIMSGIALLTEQFYSGPFHVWGWLMLSITAGTLAVAVYWWIRWKRLEPRYLDYRSLAEASRVQFFWHLAGIKDCVADHYLRGQRDDIEWIRQAMLVQQLPLLRTSKTLDQQKAISLCKSHWIDDQKNYFGGSANKAALNRRKFGVWSKRALLMLSLAIFVAIVTLISDVIVTSYFSEFDRAGLFYLIWLYGAFFAVSALFRVYLEIKVFAENANRYQHMKLYFEYSEHLISEQEANGLESCKPLFIEVGKQALAENSDWLLFHRQRPVYVPI
ncbi:hypothetical protein BEE62_07635 [Marinobacter nauticus]|uniref:SMODS and SLOG-associating 2TM effector domain-containing protein n=1 Tax=Marinobacter nauticus TaxID=2743 RepID=A0A1M2UXC7_MARNT|nr:hypothetical protein BEE62_07635 [Marinobacter nauticus]